MTCTRCQGLMLKEHMIDMEAAYGAMWNVGSRCVNCGHRHDAVLQHHRQQHAKPVPETMSVHNTFKLDWELEEESLAA